MVSLWLGCCVYAYAEEGAPAAAADEAQANNPLANFNAFNLQNYYIPEISGADETANAFWLRYAQPFGKWLFRGSLPFNRVPVADEQGGTTTTSGMGDLNAFMAYLLDTGDPRRSFGIGPQLTLPTATDDATGTGKYQGGLATVYFDDLADRLCG